MELIGYILLAFIFSHAFYNLFFDAYEGDKRINEYKGNLEIPSELYTPTLDEFIKKHYEICDETYFDLESVPLKSCSHCGAPKNTLNCKYCGIS
jgi:hypothetical protein